MKYPVVTITISGLVGRVGFLIGKSEDLLDATWPWKVHVPNYHRNGGYYLLKRNEFVVKNALNRRNNV